ncbi:hypothetical protein [Candidatus Magnetaquicoccus inordinatus]|uniref:hypothetical protein n=1 Tax=Candidatus Magnetaquicoccus inordinatus TaxID=2496818 RepID=UPI00102BE4DA|nr:hypothetical protein [Candidatus Magnetaquicoccus inordinatus]
MAYTDTQVQAWTSAQLGALADSQLDTVTSAQVALLTTVQLNGLTSTQLRGLADTQLDGLSAAQFASLAATQLNGLTSLQLSGLTAGQLDGLTSVQLTSLADTQLDGLSSDQLNSLQDSQLDGLSAAQVAGLTTSQLAGVHGMQTEGLAVVGKIDPASLSPGSTNTGYTDAKGFTRFVAALSVGAITATGTLDAKIQQATDANGSGAKDVTGLAMRQILAGNGSNQQVIFKASARNLDLKNGFTFLTLSVTAGTAASVVSAVVVGIEPSYEPTRRNVPTVRQVIG